LNLKEEEQGGSVKLINIESYEVKVSRTEQKVPIVNNVHLHSIYNPYREAENLIEKNFDQIKTKKEILVLGLGFAYHINELNDRMTQIYGDHFKIVVIEPNINVYNDCLELNLLNKKNTLVYAGFTPVELYSDYDLVHFLLKKPIVVAHPPSFNLYQQYFKNFLTFEAPTTIKDSLEFIHHPEVRKYLSAFNPEISFKDITQNIVPERSTFSEMDFLTMGLEEMVKGSVALNNDTGVS
jgi:hypothetical protein